MNFTGNYEQKKEYGMIILKWKIKQSTIIRNYFYYLIICYLMKSFFLLVVLLFSLSPGKSELVTDCNIDYTEEEEAELYVIPKFDSYFFLIFGKVFYL